MTQNVKYLNLSKNFARLRRLLLLFVIISVSFQSIAQTGYIYVNKKSLDETSSINFPFTISGGSTVVPNFNLNDKDDQIELQDLGASQLGRLWAVGTNNVLYYRDLSSSAWVATSVTDAYRVDGGPGNSCYYINTSSDPYSFITGTKTLLGNWPSHGGSPASDIGSAWDLKPYIVTNAGTIWQYSGTGTTWTQITATTNNSRIDGNPINGNAIVSKTNNDIESITSAGVATNLGRPANSIFAAQDIGVTATGSIFASYQSSTLFNGYVFNWINGTNWTTEELTSRNYANTVLTAGLGEQLWGAYTLNTTSTVNKNIFTRTFDGTNALWLNDERVRTTVTGNSEMIAVAPGTYTISELVPTGWDLQHLNVYDPTNNSSTSLTGNTATVNVAAGETVTAVFENGLVNAFPMTNNCASTYVENFGTGAVGTYGPPLIGQTSYHYQTTGPTFSNNYKIVGNTNELFSGANSLTDHTSADGQGRMLLVDANNEKDAFFRRRFTGIIPGATYDFSAWIANMNAQAPVKPNVTFDVIDPTTYTVLQSINTGDITSNAVWTKYGLTFVAITNTFDLVIRNNGLGGSGNDLAIDDISFSLIPGAAPVTTVANTTCGSLGNITVSSPATASYEYSIDGTIWQQYPNTAFNNLAPGNYTISARFIGTDNCIATKADFVAATICGNIWNDVNGDATNSSENPVNSGVWVNLVDPATQDVLQSVPVDASGNYSFVGLPQNTSYQIIITNADQTGNLNLTASSNPSGYIATGTNLSGVASTANTTGVILVNSGTNGLTAQNFGIQQPPTAITGTVPSQPNPGGTTNVTVPSTYFDGNDQNGGTITSITIPTFPTNVTSITINGTTYTAGNFPVGGVTLTGPAQVNPVTGQPLVPISIDPIDGAITPVITYTVTDNGGATSPSATVSVPFSTVTVSGNVFNDVNAGNVDNSGTANVIPPGMYASLVDALGNVVATTPTTIPASGAYSFSGVSGGNYTVVISTTQGVVGQPAPVASVPTGWANTGEFNGTPNTGNTAPINGVSATFTVGSTNVDNINFAIQQPPVAVSGALASQANPGGTNSVTVPATYFDGNDQNGGTVTSLTITTFPTFVTSITINGTTYTAGTFPVGGVTLTGPTQVDPVTGQPLVPISIDPVDGAVTPIITYTATDNGGAVSPSAAVSAPFTASLPVTLTSFTATKGEAGTIKLAWTTTEETNSDRFELQHSVNSKDWSVIATISASGDSKQLVPYGYTDAMPVSGINYYRLKMIDKDATFAYSRIQSVKLEKATEINFYPNPAAGVMFLKGVDFGKLKSVEIINTRGVVMKTVTSISNGGIDITTLSNGIYIAKVTLTDATVRVQKIVVNK